MKRKILNTGKDANNNLTVTVEYSDGEKGQNITFNFCPTATKTDILKVIDENCPISETTEVETIKEEALATIQGSLESEVGKSVTIQAIKDEPNTSK